MKIKDGLVKKGLCFAVILLLITMSTISITAIENKKDMSPQTTLENSENILAYITVEWSLFPKALPISLNEKSVNFLLRYIASCLG